MVLQVGHRCLFTFTVLLPDAIRAEKWQSPIDNQEYDGLGSFDLLMLRGAHLSSKTTVEPKRQFEDVSRCWLVESADPTLINIVNFPALEIVQSYCSGHSLTHSVENDCKKTAQFHPKYAFDVVSTNATKILKNLAKLKKN